jgi:probable rRNA maturation factor
LPSFGRRLRVALHHRQRTVTTDRAALAAAFERAALALEEELEGEAEVSLVLVSDAGIRRLNRDFAGINEATDVLAFPLDEPEGGEIGDVFISVQMAERQVGSKERSGHPHTESLEEELVLLFVHAVLHLFGHDHGEAGEEREMLEAEHRVIGSISVG